MRANEFLQEQIVDEVSMRPSILRQEAAKTGALAGIEFEMIVPGADSGEDLEPDYDSDERVTDFDSIDEFFSQGDNSPREIKKFIEGLKEGYFDWALEKRDEQWHDEGRDYFDEYVEDYFDESQAIEDAQKELKDEYGEDLEGLTSEDYDRLVEELVAEKKQEWLDEEWDDQGRYYDRAKDAWDETADWPEEQQYLRSEGYRNMSDLPYGEYSVMWPFYSGGGGIPIEDVASDFQRAIGKPVNHSTEYHGAEREENTYVVEPDSSLEANSGDGGLEFVSPPLPLDEMLSDFNKIIEWANRAGCYTNNSTGLHMNVSVPNFSRENCDYVKLALLLGDRYILEQFGRVANTYTASALSFVMKKIQHNPEQAQELLQQMRTNLSHSASKIIHNGVTSKYTSINAHEGYIEFRSPGGDWLNEDWSKLENTLLRFVVALDAACDPQKYRQDYLKKLYQVLQPNSENDPVAVFAKFSAGQLTKPQLQQFIQQIQTQRQMKKEPDAGKQYWWKVDIGNASIEVVASTKDEAIAKAADEYGLPPQRIAGAKVTALRPYTPEQNQPVSEAEEDTQQADEIYSALEGAGYQLLGSGQDATVWAKKDQNDVIKIIMPDDGKGAGRQAELFYKFYEFCQEHPNYENLPKFTDLGAGKALERFEVNGVEYMAIAMEKLTPIPEGSFEEAMVWQLSDLAMKKMSWQQAWQVLTNPASWESFEEDRIYSTIDYLERMNEQERLKYEVLFKLMTLLYHTGRINKVGWDLHTENAMMRGDTIVITDPWFGELT